MNPYNPFAPQYPFPVAVVGRTPPRSPPPPPPPQQMMSDAHAAQVVAIWKSLFPDATPLPGIGLPSQGNGVLTMTHTAGDLPPMTINGLPSKSPLANNALLSAEVSNGQWINLYEIMLPEIPGKNGEPSAIQRYTNALQRQGVEVAGNHYHWTGGLHLGHFPVAVHSQKTGAMDPLAFAQAHVNAFREVLAALGAPPAPDKYGPPNPYPG